jgi:hypothetical protein
MRSALHYPASNSTSSAVYVDWRIPENVNGGDDDVLRRLMRASTSAQCPSKQGVIQSLSRREVHSTGFLTDLNCAPTVHESNIFIPFGLLLSEKQIPDLLETLVVRSDGRTCWSRVRCAQGRRTARAATPSWNRRSKSNSFVRLKEGVRPVRPPAESAVPQVL